MDTQTRFVIPEVVSSHFHIRPGDTVADFGAGVGFFVPELARLVGSEGRLYACEIQKNLVEKLGAQAHSLDLQQVYPMWCDLEEPNGISIQTGVVDIGLLINTLFLLEDKQVAINEMSRTLRTGGKFYVIDWTESFAGMGPTAEHVISAVDVKNLFESNGFVFETEFPAGAHHYGLVFRKM